MAYTRVMLEGVRLDPTRFEWKFTRGWDPWEVTIRQLAGKEDEVAGLPYTCALDVFNTGEAGTVNGGEEHLRIYGLRITDITRVDNRVCTITLADLRKDLHDRVCPADVNLRWKDGYLNNTRFQYARDLFEYLAPLIAELEADLAPDAFDDLLDEPDYEIPDGESLAGMMLPEAGKRVTELLAIDPVVGVDGYLRFVRRGSTLDLMLDAYNWLVGAMPSWSVQSRTPRGLPRKLRFHYWERHALRCGNLDPDERRTSSITIPKEVEIQLEQVYNFDGRYGTLDELLVHYDYDATEIYDERIADVIMRPNFEGTTLEPVRGGNVNAREVINIIRRDWRLLWRVKYPEQIGRRGGWRNPIFGYFGSVTDKDGNITYSGDISGAAVRMEYTEYLAQVDEDNDTQVTWDDNIVFRSYKINDAGTLPVAPFIPTWEGSAPGEIIRLVPKPEPGRQLAVYPGRLGNNKDGILQVQVRTSMAMDDGRPFDVPVPATHIPAPEDLTFVRYDSSVPAFEVNVYFTAVRGMPNDATRWWAEERPGFEDGDVDVLEAEVGNELYMLRNFVDPSRVSFEPHGDGFGKPLNEDAVRADADRRARVLRERLGTLVGGDGVAIGTGLIVDMGHPKQAVSSLTLQVDGLAVTSRIDVGLLDNEQARDQRRRLREQLRRSELGGKVFA
jgi:hypothetical protein